MNSKSYHTSDMAYDDPDDDYEPCSKKLLPSLFAWFILISSTSSYFTLVFPLYYHLLGPSKLHLFISLATAHAILFVYVLVNFCLATFMDPGRFPKTDVLDNGEGHAKTLSSTNYKSVLINDINVRMKWCTTCLFYRPPRKILMVTFFGELLFTFSARPSYFQFYLKKTYSYVNNNTI
ncbi:palmitoyltransferase ZDHHC5 [Brachionus plicatilis]|uniref:Palmitoyltransferase ZDHHC5 n=1 Tax=Brachionus plicatilis TaxID=10195 RepID=A0A3M7PX37_BRAPC|nr:palmitoyltransferase ZDHHC5 [Brachionus plicatilis]